MCHVKAPSEGEKIAREIVESIRLPFVCGGHELFTSVSVGLSLGMAALFLAICLVIVWWIFKTGYRLKN